MSVDSGPALVDKIHKVLPITPSASWSLYGIEKDTSVWQCHDANLTSEGAVHACCTVVHSSVESVLRTLVDHNQRINWDCTVSSVKTVAMSTGPSSAPHSARNDVVAITPKVWPRWSLLRSADASLSMARWWQCNKDNKWAWMLWKYLDEEVNENPWSYTLISAFSEPDRCAIVMVVGSSVPVIPQPPLAQQMLVGLSQYIVTLQVSQHITVPTSEFRLEKSAGDGGGTDDEAAPHTVGEKRSSSRMSSSGRMVSRSTSQMSSSGTMMSPTGLGSSAEQKLESKKLESGEESDSLTSQQQGYAAVLTAAIESVQEAVSGGADDGWELVGTKGTVAVTRRSVGLSISCMRCSIVIQTPPEIILDCIEEDTKLLCWDEMMQESRTVDYVTESMWIEQWMHKPVWPATARDFCIVAGHTRVDNGSWVTAARSVVHPACPPHPDFVRGNVVECGALVEPLPGEPERCSVSYVIHFDFKGNVSAVVAHRISQLLPTCMLSLEQVCLETHKLTRESLSKQRQSAAELAAATLIAQGSRQSSRTQSRLGDNGDSGFAGDPDAEDVGGDDTLSNQTLEYPMVGHSQVDYRTLGNQAAAGVLAELLMASDIDVYQPGAVAAAGDWQFDGIEKDIVILRKAAPHSDANLFMGKGIIPLPVSKVWEALRQPHTRFGYDSMLKEMRTVATYGERLLVMYMMLEARQCLMAQARDFCFLHHERVDGSKHIIAAQSIEHPLCPVRADIQRAQIVSSGWCVEPAEQEGCDYSMVTYVGQVDLKGHAPKRLVTYVCRRQTLAINALSKYLLAAS